MLKEIQGGVCAAQGFTAAGVHCGVKANSSPDKNDLALILSQKECTAAATFTLNRVKAAPLYVTMDHLEDGTAWGVVVNSGNANARSEENAERLAKAVVGSSLVKAAMFGADANWGRVLCAMGYSKAPFRPEHVDVTFCSAAGEILVCKQGDGVAFDEDQAKKILSEQEVIIAVDLHEGEDSAECWGCDLTYDYVKINGDYRT